MVPLAVPLVTNPVTIFLIVLVVILLAPVVLNRLRIPHIIGMIVAGVVLGPFGFNVLDRDSSFDIFGQVGLLYLMFLAGLEIDMYHLRLNLRRGLVFGVLTFMVPMVMGVLASVYVLRIGWLTSVLLASMYASHTLIAYPVAARYGVTRSAAVIISVVGTIIAVIASLLVLAAAVNIERLGSFQIGAMMSLLGRIAVYCLGVLYAFPRITRWFFKNFSDNVTQYVFVLAMVFFSAWLSSVIGLEAVLGAFFAGIVLNRYVPNSSPLMNKIEFVGNALFIPYFLIGVGMMIDIRVVGSADTLWVAGVMLVVALASKWLAAYAAQRVYGMDGTDRRMMFGLTTAHTAVALAVVNIGYNIILPDGSRMMDETILNGTVLVILVTCAIAPIVTSGASARIKIRLLQEGEPAPDVKKRKSNTLIPVSNPITASSLVDIALMLRPRGRGWDGDNVYALHVRNDNTSHSKAVGRHSLALAEKAATSVDVDMELLERYDLNSVTGIVNTIEERDITQVVMGMHRKSTVIDTFLGLITEQLLGATNKMVVISRCYIPVNTLTRIVVYVPPKAQFETGFMRWVVSLANLAGEVGCRLIFNCDRAARTYIEGVLTSERYALRSEFNDMTGDGDFMMLANQVLDDDLFVVVLARQASVSYSSELAEIPGLLQRYFSQNNLVVIYPEQFGEQPAIQSFVNPMSQGFVGNGSPLWGKVREWLRNVNALKHRLIRHR